MKQPFQLWIPEDSEEVWSNNICWYLYQKKIKRMAKINIKKNAGSTDMTAMCDVAFLCLPSL
jgi:hypothetical protein